MRTWQAVLLFWAIAAGALSSFVLLAAPPAAKKSDRLVVAALPPEPTAPALPAREPDSPPVYAPAPSDYAPDGRSDAPSDVPGVSTEPLPGVRMEMMGAGGLGIFVPRVEGRVAPDPLDEPDLGPAHLPRPRVDEPAPAPPVSRSRPRLPKAPAVVEVALPVAAPPPPPPVEHRWQSVLARMRPDHVWTDLVFRGQ